MSSRNVSLGKVFVESLLFSLLIVKPICVCRKG